MGACAVSSVVGTCLGPAMKKQSRVSAFSALGAQQALLESCQRRTRAGMMDDGIAQ